MRKIHPQAFCIRVIALVAILIQCGVGAYVVRTNLETGAISIHMLIALVIVALYIFALLSTFKDRLSGRFDLPKGSLMIGWIVLILTLVQIIMGTQVREEVDVLVKTLGEEQRSLWIAQLAGTIYDIHKYFYYAVLAGAVFWAYRLRPLMGEPVVKYLSSAMFGTLLAEILL
mgnify:CR=1 FL=1